MDNEPTQDQQTLLSPAQGFVASHRIATMVVLAIGVAMLLVMMAMNLYNSSGAAQVDLSRPGYQSVRKQSIQREDNYETYPSTGDITSETIDDFKSKYDKRTKEALGADGLTPEVMSDEALLLTENAELPAPTN